MFAVQAMAVPAPRAALIASAVALHAAILRLEITTLAPCSAIASAMARPIPREEPVMTATLPLKSNSDMINPRVVDTALGGACLTRAGPGVRRERADPRGHGGRQRIGRRSLQDALANALHDRHQPKQVIGKVPVEIGHPAPTGGGAIAADGLIERRNTERPQVKTRDPGGPLMRGLPVHQQIREIGQRIAGSR